jgi:hypothetical protein
VSLDQRLDRIASHAIELADLEVAHVRVRHAIVGQYHIERRSLRERTRPSRTGAPSELRTNQAESAFGFHPFQVQVFVDIDIIVQYHRLAADDPV